MADGGLSIELDDELADSVRAAAAKKGIPVEMFIRDALTHHMFAEVEWSDDPDWAIDQQIAEEALRTGEATPWEDVKAWLLSWGTPDELPPPKWRK